MSDSESKKADVPEERQARLIGRQPVAAHPASSLRNPKSRQRARLKTTGSGVEHQRSLAEISSHLSGSDRARDRRSNWFSIRSRWHDADMLAGLQLSRDFARLLKKSELHFALTEFVHVAGCAFLHHAFRCLQRVQLHGDVWDDTRLPKEAVDKRCRE